MINYEMKDYVLDYMKDNNNIFDTDRINEYVDGLLPLYYSEIYNQYYRHLGTPLSIEITQDMVGLAIWEIMNRQLFDEYFTLFIDELYRIYEEEE